MVVKGKLITCKREVREFDKKRKLEEKLFITLAEVELTDEQTEELKEAFKDSGKQFTPAWVKDFDGYVNVSTQFALPYRDLEGNNHDSIEEDIKDGLKWVGAEVKLSLNVKEGAIYPKAILMLSEGAAYNAFAEFDE